MTTVLRYGQSQCFRRRLAQAEPARAGPWRGCKRRGRTGRYQRARIGKAEQSEASGRNSRHCEKRSDEAIQFLPCGPGLLRSARNDDGEKVARTAWGDVKPRALERRSGGGLLLI